MKRTKQILSVFLSFCMITSCMVGMSVTAGADTAVLKTFTKEDFTYQFSDYIKGDVKKITKVEALIDIDTFSWGHIQTGDNATTESAQLNTMSTNIPGVALYTYNDTRTTATYAQVLLSGNGRLLALKVTYSDSTSESMGNWDVPEFKAPTAKTGLTANGSAQALVSEGVITSGTGTIEYSLDNSNWSTDIPKGTDAEDYTVYYRVKYGSEYYQPLYNGIQVTIGEPSTPATVAVTGVSLDKTAATLTVGGDAVALTATVTPNDATAQTVTWTSSHTSVATVTDGVVTPVAVGTATITVTATNGTDDISDDKTATCTVYVNAASAAKPTVTISPEGAGTVETTKDGNDLKLTATANPGFEFDHWSYSEEVTAKTSEKNPNTLYYYYNSGSEISSGKFTNLTAHFKATTVPVTAIRLNYSTYSMKVGESNALTTAFTPADATNLNLTFASSNTNVVTISDIGAFTAVGVGTATLTVTATNGTDDTSDDVKATCTVTVNSASGSGGISGYGPYYPTTTTTTTTTNTGSFADETKENTNYSGAEINMKSDELEKAILTDEDKKVIAAGGKVTVELEVEEMTPTAEEKKEVEAAVEAAKEASGEDYTVAMYFDANLFKTSNGTKTQLHETNGKIAVSFKLPEQFKNTDSSVTRTYAVARIHDGKTEILVCEYDPETDLLTFYTDKFSTYALMYEDAKADDADVSAVDDDDEQGDEGAVDDDDEQFDEADDEALEDDTDDDFAEDKTDGGTDDDVQAAVDAAATTDESNPNTGAPLAGMGVFAVMSLFAAAAAYTAKKRKNK